MSPSTRGESRGDRSFNEEEFEMVDRYVPTPELEEYVGNIIEAASSSYPTLLKPADRAVETRFALSEDGSVDIRAKIIDRQAPIPPVARIAFEVRIRPTGWHGPFAYAVGDDELFIFTGSNSDISVALLRRVSIENGDDLIVPIHTPELTERWLKFASFEERRAWLDDNPPTFFSYNGSSSIVP